MSPRDETYRRRRILRSPILWIGLGIFVCVALMPRHHGRDQEGDRAMTPSEQSDSGVELAPNQHHEHVNAESTRVMLVSMLDHWEKAGCDCCAPTVLDDAIEAIGPDPAFWDRMRKFAIELAVAAQWQIDYWQEDSRS